LDIKFPNVFMKTTGTCKAATGAENLDSADDLNERRRESAVTDGRVDGVQVYVPNQEAEPATVMLRFPDTVASPVNPGALQEPSGTVGRVGIQYVHGHILARSGMDGPYKAGRNSDTAHAHGSVDGHAEEFAETLVNSVAVGSEVQVQCPDSVLLESAGQELRCMHLQEAGDYPDNAVEPDCAMDLDSGSEAPATTIVISVLNDEYGSEHSD
jgi:hypothetical protein